MIRRSLSARFMPKRGQITVPREEQRVLGGARRVGAAFPHAGIAPPRGALGPNGMALCAQWDAQRLVAQRGGAVQHRRVPLCAI